MGVTTYLGYDITTLVKGVLIQVGSLIAPRQYTCSSSCTCSSCSNFSKCSSCSSSCSSRRARCYCSICCGSCKEREQKFHHEDRRRHFMTYRGPLWSGAICREISKVILTWRHLQTNYICDNWQTGQQRSKHFIFGVSMCLQMSTQITKTFRLTSIRYQSDAFVSERYHIDIDPRVFAIWVYAGASTNTEPTNFETRTHTKPAL